MRYSVLALLAFVLTPLALGWLSKETGIGMFDTIAGILGIAIAIFIVTFLAWAESDFKWKNVIAYFVVFGGLPILAMLYNPFSNLKDWQFGVFGLLSALAIIGVALLVERGKSSR